jgi:hypothetical protein
MLTGSTIFSSLVSIAGSAKLIKPIFFTSTLATAVRIDIQRGKQSILQSTITIGTTDIIGTTFWTLLRSSCSSLF